MNDKLLFTTRYRNIITAIQTKEEYMTLTLETPKVILILELFDVPNTRAYYSLEIKPN